MPVPKSDREHPDHHDHHSEERDEMAGQSRRGKQALLPRREVVRRVHHATGSYDGEPSANPRRSGGQDYSRTGRISKMHQRYCYISTAIRQRRFRDRLDRTTH
jgi:hypothetical protein